MSVEVVQEGVAPPEIKKRGGHPVIRFGVLLLFLFLGYKTVPFYYYYFDFKSNCARVLQNAAVESDQEIRRNLFEVVRRHGIEKEARDIGIQRIGRRIKIWLNYQEDLDVSLMGKSISLYRFEFTPSAEKVYEE